MGYILKWCGSAGGLHSFVQQCVFNGASHEQEPYMAQDRKGTENRERQKEECGECRGGEMVRSKKKRSEKREKKEGEEGAGETGCD